MILRRQRVSPYGPGDDRIQIYLMIDNGVVATLYSGASDGSDPINNLVDRSNDEVNGFINAPTCFNFYTSTRGNGTASIPDGDYDHIKEWDIWKKFNTEITLAHQMNLLDVYTAANNMSSELNNYFAAAINELKQRLDLLENP